MSSFLILNPLPEELAHLGEHVVRTATCFLEAQGAKVDRTELGTFRRATRGATAEVLALVTLIMKDESDDDAGRARMLEGVLRTTLAAAGARGSDIRVFAAAE